VLSINTHRIHKREKFNSSLVYLDTLSIVEFKKKKTTCVCRNIFEVLVLCSCSMDGLKINNERNMRQQQQ